MKKKFKFDWVKAFTWWCILAGVFCFWWLMYVTIY